jgi:hypothetical protein
MSAVPKTLAVSAGENATKKCPRFEKGFLDFLTPDDKSGKLFTLNFTTAMESSLGFGKWKEGTDQDGCDQQCGNNSGQCNAPGAIRYLPYLHRA